MFWNVLSFRGLGVYCPVAGALDLARSEFLARGVHPTTGRGIARFRFLVTSKPRAKHLKKSPRTTTTTASSSHSWGNSNGNFSRLHQPASAVFSFEKHKDVRRE